jgi:hypothetical protein
LFVLSSNQQQINNNLTNGTIVKEVHRFNKLVSAVFDEGEPEERTFSTLVNSTMGMPTSHPQVATGLTLPGGAACSEVGPYYPGEFQSDPTARTRMLTVRNTDFVNNIDRLYVGTTMRMQWEDPTISGAPAGAVHCFRLAADGTPTYLQTLTLEQDTGEVYQVSGLDTVPGAWLGPGAIRNVIAATALHTKISEDAIDRLALIQDTFDPNLP